jgi:tetratricopeptide (TPR) repeat protein
VSWIGSCLSQIAGSEETMFKWLGGAKSAQLSSDQVRQIVFDAVIRGDAQAFEDACRTHEGLILATFGQWKKISEAVANDQQAAEDYFHALTTVANYFRSKGHPELFELLVGPAETNPIELMKKAMLEAQRQSELRDYGSSNKTLEQMLRTMESWQGHAVVEYRARMHGLLGINYYRLQNLEEAVRCTRQALADCHELKDEEGVRIYGENLRALGG